MCALDKQGAVISTKAAIWGIVVARAQLRGGKRRLDTLVYLPAQRQQVNLGESLILEDTKGEVVGGRTRPLGDTL